MVSACGGIHANLCFMPFHRRVHGKIVRHVCCFGGRRTLAGFTAALPWVPLFFYPSHGFPFLVNYRLRRSMGLGFLTEGAKKDRNENRGGGVDSFLPSSRSITCGASKPLHP